jgi:hypothetical protein
VGLAQLAINQPITVWQNKSTLRKTKRLDKSRVCKVDESSVDFTYRKALL